MVSIPRKVADARRSVLFPTAISDAFVFIPDSGYNTRDTLLNGLGYWLKFGWDFTTNIVGDSILADTIVVVAGWNLIGSISSPIVTDSIVSIPPAITTSNFFGFDGGYNVASNIVPGSGYWVKSSQDGKLILSSVAVTMRAADSIKIIPTSDLPPQRSDEIDSERNRVPK